jgi:hypothetical protein
MTLTELDEPAAPPSPPVPPPTDPEPRRPFDSATARLAVLALASGIALDIGIRGGPANVVVVGGLVLAVLAFVTDPHVERTEARWLALAALVPTVFLAVRVSPWLIVSNLALAAGLSTAAICLARSGSVFDTTPLRLVHRTAWATGRAVVGIGVLRPLVPRMPTGASERAGRLAIALLITVPTLVIVVALLASADAVFAGLLVPDVDLGPATGHVVLAVLAAAGVVSVVAAARGDADDPRPPGTFGTIEVAVMLGLATVVMALFAVAQLVALTDAGDRLIEEAGLTPAEYARSGFFQLCWATALIVAFLALVRWLAAPAVLTTSAMRLLSAAVPLLAIGLVVVSLRRMALYDEAFGLTMLRLWVVGAAVWMGLVLLMVAARNLGLGAGREWVLGGAAVAALVLVVVADAANPEAFVVRHNIDRAADGAELDADYLTLLSGDAVPAYLDAVRNAPAELRPELARAYARCPAEEATGVARLNLGAARAADALDDLPEGLDPLESPGGCGYRNELR